MDDRIRNIMYKYKLLDTEIEDILTIEPSFKTLSYEEFKLNCKLLAEYGYPISDLDFLIKANPKIFVLLQRFLRERLENLKWEYGDVERILKYDPTII